LRDPVIQWAEELWLAGATYPEIAAKLRVDRWWVYLALEGRRLYQWNPAPRGVHALETGLNDLLLEAGVPVEVPDRDRTKWEPMNTAERCLRWRRRRGYWPGGADAKRAEPGELPPEGIMKRFLGGARPAFVQLGCEALLGPIDLPAPVAV
jgi:hypothetical protein